MLLLLIADLTSDLFGSRRIQALMLVAIRLLHLYGFRGVAGRVPQVALPPPEVK